MPLRVVMGRANAGKTGVILDWALEALRDGSSPTLIVPNLADAHRLKMEISGKAPLGVRVETTGTFIEELWQLHGDGRRLVGDAIRSAVVRKTLAQAPGQKRPVSAGAPGFERLMIRAAESSRYIAARGEAAGSDGGTLVLGLLDGYRSELASLGMIEPEWAAAIVAHARPVIGFVATLRFTTYSASQAALLCSLAEQNAVCAALTWEEGFAPTAVNDRIAAELLASAEEVRVVDEVDASTELGLMSQRLYSGACSLKPAGHLLLGEARGREAEASLVVRLAAQIIDEDVLPERVAIVFPQLAARVNLLRNAIASEGLEADFDCPLAVGATPLGRALTALLRIAVGRGARVDALHFLQGPFSDSGPEAVGQLDTGWRKKRQTDDASRVLEGLIRLGGSTGESGKLVREVSRLPIDGQSAPKWQELVDGLISTAVADSRVGSLREDASAHRSVSQAVAEMAVVPGAPFGALDVLEALPTLTCALTSEESGGRIQVVQASRIGSRRFDAIIIGGLTSAESPGAIQESFASEVGNLVSGRLGGDSEALANMEFYSLVTRARSRLALVSQTVSSEGARQAKSPLLEAVLDLYRDPQAASEEGRDAVGIQVQREDDARAFGSVFTDGRRAQRVRAADQLPMTRSVAHELLDPDTANRAFGDRVFSATELETYIECPYRWFYTRVMRPAEVDAELDAAELGSRAHRLLSDFYGALKEAGEARVTPENLPEALKLFEQNAKHSEKGMAPALSLGEEIDVGRARLWARHVVEDDAYVFPGYRPYGHEIAFGREQDFEFAGVPMAGRIDRIDVGHSGVIVTDYKSTADVAKLVRPSAGFSIQHLVYAFGASQLLGQPVQGSVYRSLRSRQVRGIWRRDLLKSVPSEACDKDVIDEAGFSALVAMAEERIAAAVEGIRAGKIPRTPRTASACRYCDLAKHCEGARS